MGLPSSRSEPVLSAKPDPALAGPGPGHEQGLVLPPDASRWRFAKVGLSWSLPSPGHRAPGPGGRKPCPQLPHWEQDLLHSQVPQAGEAWRAVTSQPSPTLRAS